MIRDHVGIGKMNRLCLFHIHQIAGLENMLLGFESIFKARKGTEPLPLA